VTPAERFLHLLGTWAGRPAEVLVSQQRFVSVQAEYDEIASRAEAAGRPLRPMPKLMIADGYTKAAAGLRGRRYATVCLSPNDLDDDPRYRAWGIAHELGHVWIAQRRRGPGSTALRKLPAYALTVLGTTAFVVLSLAAASLGRWILLGMAIGTLVTTVTTGQVISCAADRAEETEADEVAAVVFGEVLSPEGVEMVRREEESVQRKPRIFWTHPLPAKRRRSGLAARRRAGLSIINPGS
jgi:hypothetical protein